MDTKEMVIGGSIIAVAALIILWRIRKDAIAIGGAAVDAAKAGATAVNPLNHNNIFANGVNAVGGAVAMDPNWSLGGWIYDITHPPVSPKK